MRGEQAVLELSGIVKSFGPVHALRGADFVLAPGEVHALLGENGAGKSTLMHVAYGMLAPDAGTILVRGEKRKVSSPREARALGIGMVHQHFTSIPALTVAENIALAVGRRSGGRTAGQADGPTEKAFTQTLMAGFAADALVESLSVAERQRLEIVKALATGATILLLDEPSAVLAPSEVEELLALVRDFTAGGGSAALITHKLPEVFLAGDRVTVLRDGQVALHGSVRDQTEAGLAEAMIGRPPARGEPGPSAAGPLRRDVAASSVPVVRLGGVDILPGELVGIAAILGNGQRELLRAVSAGRDVSGPVAFVPEDRTTEGLIAPMTLTENLVLGLDRDPRWSRGWGLDWGAARSRTSEVIEDFGIRASSPDVAAGTLSGGNQQKILLARALEQKPRVLVAENPTRGLDIRSTAEVHARLRAAAAAGAAVLVYSTDLDEVLELGERVLVVHAGRVREAARGADRSVVGDMMLGLGGGGRESGER